MVMYGIYNSDTLEKLISTVHKMHNKTAWNEKLFVGKLNNWYQWYLTKKGVEHYAIISLFYITTMKENMLEYMKNLYSIEDVYQCDKNSFKGLFANFSFASNEITGNSK